MFDFPAVNLAALEHACGSAENIPSLFERAKTDTRGGHVFGLHVVRSLKRALSSGRRVYGKLCSRAFFGAYR